MAATDYTSAQLEKAVGIPDRKPIDAVTLRTAAAPTDSYVATDHIPVARWRTGKLIIEWNGSVDFTSLEVRVDESRDGSTFVPLLQFSPVAAGLTPVTPWTGQLTRASFATPGGGAIDMILSSTLYLRAQIKRTGGSNVGTVGVYFIGGASL